MISPADLVQKKEEYMSTQYNTVQKNLSKKDVQRNREIPLPCYNAGKTLKYMEKQRLDLDVTLNYIGKKDLTRREKDMVTWAVTYEKQLNYIVKRVNLFEECKSLRRNYVRVLLGLLLYGQKRLPRKTIEAAELFYYEEDLWDAFVEANTVFDTNIGERIPTYVRVNTLSISLEQCISAFCNEGWELLDCPKYYHDFVRLVSRLKAHEFVRDFHISELLVFPSGTPFYEHRGYLKGKFVIQDKGSCLASFLLNPKPGSRVFDIGAATGKTTNHIASIVNNEANVYAADFHPHRYNKLVSFLELTNSKCVESMMSDVKKICIDNLDYILVDASCSRSGISFQQAKRGSLLKLRRSYYLNFKLLLYALQNFPTVKRVVYAVNSIFPEEGEKVVDFVLSVVGKSYELLDVKELLWNEWYSFGNVKTHCGQYPFAGKCLRADIQKDKCSGYFIAVFERNFDVPVAPYGFEKWEKGDDMMDEDDSEEDSEKPFPKPKFQLVNGFPKKMKSSGIKTAALRKKALLRKTTTVLVNQDQKNRYRWTNPQTSTKAPVLLSILKTSKTLLPTPQASTKNPVLLPTPQASTKNPVLLPTPQASTKNPVLLPTPQASTKNPVLLPTPQASTKTLLPTPQTCTKTHLPIPQTSIRPPGLLPSPQTSVRPPGLLPAPQTSIRPPGLLPTPQTFTNNPVLLRAPATSNRTLLPTPQISMKTPGLLPTPQTSYTANRM